MGLTRFDRLVLVLGGATVLGGTGFSLSSGVPQIVAILGQFLLFGVLVIAVFFGRRGGSYAALGASVLYIALLLPTLSEGGPMRSVLAATFVRLLTFGVIGILGGEFLTRVRYALVRSETPGWIDEWSRLYNQRYMHAELDRAAARYERYGEACSVVVISLATSAYSGLAAARQRALVRDLANRLRSDVRSVDQVARLDDGRFVALLPHTAREGGLVVADRLLVQARSEIATSADAVTAACLSLPDDAQELLRFIDAIATPEAKAP